MTFKLVENWRKLWKADVIRALVVAATAPELYDWLAQTLGTIPELGDHKLLMTQILIGIAAALRYRAQPELHAK
jgi:hypothetical protein